MASPTAFVDQVKDVLDHLYDLSYLSEHPLTTDLLPARLPTGVSRAHALRQAILDAIEELHGELPPSATNRPWRMYHIIELRYVETLSYREVMSELGLSQPQYHREQRRAVEALATLLWEQLGHGEFNERRPTRLAKNDAWKDNLQAVARGPEIAVDLTELIGGVVSLLERVALASAVDLQSEVTGSRRSVDGNRTMLRQLLIAATSFMLQGTQGGRLAIVGTIQETNVSFDLSYRGGMVPEKLHTAAAREHWAEGKRLLTILDGSWTYEREAEGAKLSILLNKQCQQLLVIDDNPDMVQLITRFVSGQGYTVIGAVSVDEGIALAQSQHPNVIVLDIMMPDRDGWDALQVLKNHPATQSVPVLVCTILAQSELALALGAQGFLRKPITRPRLLESLQRCRR